MELNPNPKAPNPKALSKAPEGFRVAGALLNLQGIGFRV